MIPPCDPSILEGNPQFKRLYENLTANLLNPDGSTRAQSAGPAREAVLEVRRDASAQQNIGDEDAKFLCLGPETMPSTERKEEDQGAYAQAVGVCCRQRASG